MAIAKRDAKETGTVIENKILIGRAIGNANGDRMIANVAGKIIAIVNAKVTVIMDGFVHQLLNGRNIVHLPVASSKRSNYRLLKSVIKRHVVHLILNRNRNRSLTNRNTGLDLHLPRQHRAISQILLTKRISQHIISTVRQKWLLRMNPHHRTIPNQNWTTHRPDDIRNGIAIYSKASNLALIPMEKRIPVQRRIKTINNLRRWLLQVIL